MLHLRVVSPPDRTDAVLGLLHEAPAVANLALMRGASLEPAGDLVQCDLAREGTNQLMSALRDLNVHVDGSIALFHIDLSVSNVARLAEGRVPGHGSDAAVWEEVDARVRDESTLTVGFVVLLVIASLIAAVGLFEDAPILIVGAMVVGPEYGPIAGLSLGLFKQRGWRVRAALVTLAVGLVAGVAAAYLATALADGIGLVPDEFSPHLQPLTGFVVDPSALSFVVAFLAGIAGTLSLTQAKANALTGVLISVTTIPAVAAIGVSGALGSWGDARGATVQLLLNLAALIVAGVLTLWAQREAWDELVPPPRRWPRRRG